MCSDSAATADSSYSVATRMTGFPPPHEQEITVANWQEHENLPWSLQHMREIIPSQVIPASRILEWFEYAGRALGNPAVERLNDGTQTVADILADTHTDAFLVLHHGRIVEERYFGSMTDSTRHLIMSVSKSIVGCVAGLLVERGQLAPNAQVTDYVPEVAESGYGGASVRDVLDMRTGVAFSEAYTAEDSEVRVMERSMGWRPPLAEDPRGAYAFLAEMDSEGPHGGQFVYRSADTDMLGWVCERSAGRRMADLISELIWQPIGAEFDAEITCDSVGTAIHDGGVSAALRDLGRFGQMVLDDGLSFGRRVVPATWFADCLNPGSDVREAFANTDNEPMLPGGWYRNQFWFFQTPRGPIQLCLGIHGQLIYVDRATRTVVVKLSSWPDAQHAAHLADTLRACNALALDLAG